MPLRYAYNTNGTAWHRLDDALVLLSESGYDGIALTLDHHYLDPFAPDWERNATALRRRVDELGLGVVIETGAHFLLDHRQKHEPTFVSAAADGRQRRLDFLKRAADIGVILGAEVLSFWSGRIKEGVDPKDATSWMHEGVGAIVDYAKRQGIVPALEPEPEMFVSTVDDYAALQRAVPDVKLALDLGHVLVTGEREPDVAIREFGAHIADVHLEDMKRGDHVHLAFGDGDMDVPAALRALNDIGFKGLICIELSRDSYRADVMVPQARQAVAEYERAAAA